MQLNKLTLRRCLLLLIPVLLFLNGNTQKNYLKISGGAEIPTGFFGRSYNSGWGIYLTDYYEVQEGGGILLSTGITHWKASDFDINAGFLLTRLGFRQFVIKNFYFQVDAGIAIFISDWGDGKRFTYGGGIGYLIRGKGNNGFDISVRMNKIPTRSWLGIGIGYQFKL